MKDSSRPETDLDQNSPEFAADPWSRYEDLRQRCPVAHTDAHGGFWVVSRYDDVVSIARDDMTFSSTPTTVIPDTGVYNLIPLQSDPPSLPRYRAALQPFFSPDAMRDIEAQIRRFTEQCIDAFIESGECDLVTDLANPVPSMTALRLIGFDPDDWHDFAGPMHQLSYSPDGSDERRRALQDIAALDDRIEHTISERRASPRDDAISALIKHRTEGVAFNDQELHGLVKMLLFGGLDTTMASTSNALLFLGRHPEERRRLAEDPGLLPGAIEELLRYEAPVHAFARRVTKDTQVGDQAIAAGERVYMLWASANRDPEQFDEPESVDLTRRPNRHLTFGIGGHRCLGAPLARLEMKIMLQAVLERLPDFVIQEDGVRHPTNVTVIWGRTSLPTTFTPGKRR